MAEMIPKERELYDARADHEAWGHGAEILEPWVRTTKAIGSDELTQVMEKALAEEARWSRLIAEQAEELAAEGVEGFKQFITMFRNALPDMHLSVEDPAEHFPWRMSGDSPGLLTLPEYGKLPYAELPYAALGEVGVSASIRWSINIASVDSSKSSIWT
jgi:hypothetical protein